MIRKVLTRAAIVLTVGWSACAGWFAYSNAPSDRAFQLAWSARWTPPADDLTTTVVPVAGPELAFPSETSPGVMEQVMRDYNAEIDPEIPLGPRFDVKAEQPSNQTERALKKAYERVQADLEQHRIAVRYEVAAFALSSVAVWLVPIAVVWSVVWIFAPLSGQKPTA